MDYNEIICEAIDTIVQERLKSLNFNRTVTCIIIDNSQRNKGKYRVQYGSMTFYAYSENIEYENNEAVQVLIPNGDYSAQKLILSKYFQE